MTHPDHHVLADLAAGVDIADAESVRAHLDGCVDCQHVVDDVINAQTILADTELESMPAEVAARLASVVDLEVNRRRSGTSDAERQAASAEAAARTALGSFGENLPSIGDKVIEPRTHVRSS